MATEIGTEWRRIKKELESVCAPAKRPRRRSTKTLARQKALLEALVECGGNLSEACRAAGVGRRTVYHWMKDEAFRAEYRATFDGPATDRLVEVALERAYLGIREPVLYQGQPVYDADGNPLYRVKYSDKLLMFLIKRYRPEFRNC